MMSTKEEAIEKIALILLTFEEEETIYEVSLEAQNMAVRGARGWWTMPGRPEFNAKMAHLKKKSKRS